MLKPTSLCHDELVEIEVLRMEIRIGGSQLAREEVGYRDNPSKKRIHQNEEILDDKINIVCQEKFHYLY